MPIHTNTEQPYQQFTKVTTEISALTFRPTVYGLIQRGSKLCLCRSHTGTLWLPGGGVDSGERLQEALAREIHEETKLKHVSIGKLVGVYENFIKSFHAHIFIYQCSTNDVELAEGNAIEDQEIAQLEWLTLEEIRRERFHDLHDGLMALVEDVMKENTI